MLYGFFTAKIHDSLNSTLDLGLIREKHRGRFANTPSLSSPGRVGQFAGLRPAWRWAASPLLLATWAIHGYVGHGPRTSLGLWSACAPPGPACSLAGLRLVGGPRRVTGAACPLGRAWLQAARTLLGQFCAASPFQF